MVPTSDDVDRWVDEVFSERSDVDAIRTGALFPQAAEVFGSRGFREIDRLALLERPIPSTEPLLARPRHPDVKLRALKRRDLVSAATIDAASFEHGWQNDAGALGEICGATPSARARRAVDGRDDVGFAITGVASRTGYLQRIAVAPEARRRGVAGLLVDDAIRWLMRRGATTALVNTGVENAAASALYTGRGFRRRDDGLVVLEYRR